MNKISEIHVRRAMHVELWFSALAHLDLGADSANLFDPRLPTTAWSKDLHRAYLASPGRLYAQITPLLVPDLASLLHRLERLGVPGLSDPADHELCRQMALALADLRDDVKLGWDSGAAQWHELRGHWRQQLLPTLQSLREALWQSAGRAAPTLRLYHCEALLMPDGARGRSTRLDDDVLVAVALHGTAEDALCQAWHEELHFVSDPAVRTRFAEQVQDSALGAPGHALHGALEHAAVQLGWRLVEQHAPALRQGYLSWAARYGYQRALLEG